MEAGRVGMLGSLRKRVVSALYASDAPAGKGASLEAAGPSTSMWVPTAERGFLPSVVPRRSDFFAEAEVLLEELQRGLLHQGAHAVRQRCQMLPTPRLQERLAALASSGAQGAAEADELAERAMIVYGFIAHCYLHAAPAAAAAPPQPRELPATVAIPWVAASVYCGRRPGLDYAACVLSNVEWVAEEGCSRGSGGAAPAAALVSWRGGGQSVSQPRALCSATGLRDECWFYEVHGLVERAAAPAVGALGRGLAAAAAADVEELSSALHAISGSLRAMAALMPRMTERCDPDVFHADIRNYLGGVSEPVRLRGVRVGEGVLKGFEPKKPARWGGAAWPAGDDVCVQLQGASGAQSALIPCVDAFLGITHHGAAELPEYMVEHAPPAYADPSRAAFPSAASLLAVDVPCPLPHLPPPHRALLLQLQLSAPASVATVHALSPFVSTREAELLTRARDECVRSLSEWRKAHMALVRQFILRPSAKPAAAAVPALEPRHLSPKTTPSSPDARSRSTPPLRVTTTPRPTTRRKPMLPPPIVAEGDGSDKEEVPEEEEGATKADKDVDVDVNDSTLDQVGTGGTRLIEFLAGRLLDTVRSISSRVADVQGTDSPMGLKRLPRAETHTGALNRCAEKSPGDADAPASAGGAGAGTRQLSSMGGLDAELPRRVLSMAGGLSNLDVYDHVSSLRGLARHPRNAGGVSAAHESLHYDFQKMVGSSVSLAWTMQQVKRVEQLKRQQKILLRYEKKDAYMNGMEDILATPALSMQEEFARPDRWTDWRGVSYTLQAEWEYVNGEAARKDGCTPGVRDENHAGKTPQDFVREVNAFIARRRFWQRGGVRLRLSVGKGGKVAAACVLSPCVESAQLDADDGRTIPEEHAFLTENEVIAVRLYTGPAYQPINTFLREVAELKDSGARRAKACDPSFTFTCTCKYICRAIRKLAAVATDDEVATPLFRAVRGELPKSFWEPEADRMVCAIDTAFMSTSRNRQTPIEYMDEGEGAANVLWQLFPAAPINVHRYRERGTVFCRGADVSMLSQFRNEEEVLFPPCTMLVVQRGGSSSILPPLSPGSEAPPPSPGSEGGLEGGFYTPPSSMASSPWLGADSGRVEAEASPPPTPPLRAAALSAAAPAAPPGAALSRADAAAAITPDAIAADAIAADADAADATFADAAAFDADAATIAAALEEADWQGPGAPTAVARMSELGQPLLPPAALAPSAGALSALRGEGPPSLARAFHCRENGRHFMSITAQPCFI